MNKFTIFFRTMGGWLTSAYSVLLAVILAVCTPLADAYKPVGIKQTESVEFAANLGRGWNLGGALCCCYYTLDPSVMCGVETEVDAGGSVYTTKEVFEKVKEAGFGFVRIPVTWKNHFKMEPGYEIDKAWMNRVQQVVDWALECDLKVILNTHHDSTTGGDWNSWYIADMAHYDTTRDILTSLWSQISERFKYYDNNLIFETLNEPGYAGAKYGGHGNDESRYVLGKLNLDALAAIRAAGGENENRFVLIATHGAVDGYETNSALVLPDDPHVLVSIHPYVGASDKMHDIKVWHRFLMAQKFFLNKGYGVVMTEFGDVTSDVANHYKPYEEGDENINALVESYKFYVNLSDKFGIPVCLWDDDQGMGLFSRGTLTWRYPSVVNALTGYIAE